MDETVEFRLPSPADFLEIVPVTKNRFDVFDRDRRIGQVVAFKEPGLTNTPTTDHVPSYWGWKTAGGRVKGKLMNRRAALERLWREDSCG